MKKYIVVLIGALFLACSGQKSDSDAFGTFEATEIIISAEVPGRILWFNLEEGQPLDSNAFVGLIDTTDWILKRAQLEAQRGVISSRYPGVASQIAVQQQQLNNLRIDKERVEKLYKDGAATKKQLDDINGSIDMVEKQILSIQTQNSTVGGELLGLQAQIAMVDESLHRCRVSNPIKGVVLDKYVEANEMVGAGKPLYKIADLDVLYLRVYVSGAQLPHLKLGQKVDVFVDLNEKKNTQTEGEVSWISSTAEFTPKIIQTKEERVNLVYAVKVRVKNDGSMKIGMPGEIRFKK